MSQGSMVASAPRLGAAVGARRAEQSLLRRLKRDWVLLALMFPGLVDVVVFVYLPNLGNIIAFQAYLPFLGFSSPFVGFENFRELFAAQAFWSAVRNTVVISAMQLLLYFPVPIILALMLSSLIGNNVRRII